MKKIILLALLALFFFGEVNSQVKVNFSLTNPRIVSGIFMYDLKATVPAGQTWNVGASNIKLNFTTTPASSLTVISDNPAVNSNPNINSGIYSPITTTNPGAMSCNITTFASSGFYVFTPGTYTIATLRWTVVTPFANATMTFRLPPTGGATVVYDGTTPLVANTGYTVTNPVVTDYTNLTVEIPKEFAMYQNYPNPFNPTTSIKYDIPNNSFVKLVVYDVTGKEVETLVNDNLQAGKYESTFNGSNYPSGIYFAKIEAGSHKHIVKMVMIK